MISASELASMRATQVLALPDTATITRRTLVSDGAGGQTETTTTSTAACRTVPATAQDIERARQLSERAGQLSEKSGWRITFAQGADVRSTDRITVGARSFEILTLLAGGSWETARVALCAER